MMKPIYLILTSVLVTAASCFQSTLDLAPKEAFEYHSSTRVDGNAFYAFEHAKGQIHYMLDYGDAKGVWQPYGPQMTGHSDVALQFDVVERPGAASYYLLHPNTGQLYYTVEGANASGTWEMYGGKISTRGNASLQFDAEARTEGNSFYALDTNTGQMYFMNDYGPEAGRWSTYGKEVL